MPKHPKSHKKEKYMKKLRIVSICEATGIPSTFTPPANTTENSHQSPPKGQLRVRFPPGVLAKALSHVE